MTIALRPAPYATIPAVNDPFPLIGPNGELPLMDADFAGARFWYDGAFYADKAAWQTAIGSASPAAGPDYADWDGTTNVAPFSYLFGTAVIRYRKSSPTSTLVALWANRGPGSGFSNRIELYLDTVTRVYVSPLGSFVTAGAQGYNQVCYSYSSGNRHRLGVNGDFYVPSFPYTSGESGFGGSTIGCRRTVGANVDIAMDGTNDAMARFAWWPVAFADEAVATYSTIQAGTPIHLIGDSFVASGSLGVELQKLQTGYRSVSNDGIGGARMLAHATRLGGGLPPARAHATVVIADGGLTYDTQVEVLDALARFDSSITHGRWLYLEPNYTRSTEKIGQPRRAEIDAIMASARARYPGNFVETLTEMQARTNATAQEITDGLWGAGFMANDIHPNAAGYLQLADVINAAILAKGW